MGAIGAMLGRRHFATPRSTLPWICGSCQSLSTSPILPSGHNHWSGIKHAKGRNDAAKSKEWLMISHEVMRLSKFYGPDPKSNPRLASAMAKAKRSGMAKSTVESAIARGQGVSTSGAPLESLTIEAMLPSSVGVVIECLTDQRGRALQDIRTIITKSGGTVRPTSYLFEKKGRISFEKPADLSVDDYLDRAIDSGATDVDSDENGRLVVFTEQTETKKVADKLCEAAELKLESYEVIWDPKKDTMVKVDSDETAEQLEEALQDIREDPSVQSIYVNYTRC